MFASQSCSCSHCPQGGATSAHSGARAGAPRWSWARLFPSPLGVRPNRCKRGNAVAGVSGHCWSLAGDVGTEPGTVTDWLCSEWGCGGGEPRTVAGRSEWGDLGGGFGRCGRGFRCCGAEETGRTRAGFPSAMEPRTAESVSSAPDSPGSLQGMGLSLLTSHPNFSLHTSLTRTYFNRILTSQLCTAIIVFFVLSFYPPSVLKFTSRRVFPASSHNNWR